MALRGWQASCAECQWNAHAVRREHAEAAKHNHEQSTGHRNVAIYQASEGDPAARYSGGDLPPRS
jgi:hypothetical protein